MTYTFAGVAKILEISESKLRYWSQVGFVGPSVRRGGKQVFNFQDLVSVKAAKELADRGFKAAEVRKALDAVRASLPHIPRPWIGSGCRSTARRWWSSTRAAPTTSPASGCSTSASATWRAGSPTWPRATSPAVTPLPGAVDRSGEARGRNAYDWFMEGTRLEARPDVDPADDQAALCFRRALALDPGLAPAHTNLGIIAYRRGERSRAKESFETALALDPDQPEARFNLANLILEEGDLELAVAELRRVLQIAPDFADAHFNLAVALERLGGRSQARAHLEKYIALEPEPAAPWAEQARVLIARLSD